MSAVEGTKRAGISELVDRLSPQVAETVRQDLIRSVGNALRVQQREGQAALQSLAKLLRHQAHLKVESEKLDEFIQHEVHNKNAQWGMW